MGSRLLPYGAPNDHSAVITVIVDDLAFLAVDAVVRPADESLAPLTSEGSRLDRLAGERFAAQRIRGAILDAVRSADWAPRSVRTLARTLEATNQQLASSLGRPPRATGRKPVARPA